MEVRETTPTFAVARGSCPMFANRTIVFPRAVDKAVAAVRGYQVGFAAEGARARDHGRLRGGER